MKSPSPEGRRPFFDSAHPIPIAHRGGGTEWPENTMLAFSSAVRLGFRYLETDVRVTADGLLVAFHDERLDRVADRPGRLCDLPFEELRHVRVGGEPIPRLDEVLGAWPEARVYIDAKVDDAVAPLVEAIARFGAEDRVCVGAFSTHRVRRLRRLSGGRLATWMSSGEIVRLRLASLGLPAPAFASSVSSTQVPVRHGPVPLVDRRFVAEAHRRGIAVHVLANDDRSEIERLLDLGADGILSNCPTVLRDVFLARGIWAG